MPQVTVDGQPLAVDEGVYPFGRIATVKVTADAISVTHGGAVEWPQDDWSGTLWLGDAPTQPQALFAGRVDVHADGVELGARFFRREIDGQPRAGICLVGRPKAGSATVKLDIDPFAPMPGDKSFLIRLPIFPEAAGKLFRLAFTLSEPAGVPLFEWVFPRPGEPSGLRLAAQADELAGALRDPISAGLPDLAGNLADGLGLTLPPATMAVTTADVSVRWGAGGIALDGLSVTLPEPLGLTIELIGFGFDARLAIGDASGGEAEHLTLKATNNKATWMAADAGKPFTLHIKEGRSLALEFRPEGPTLVADAEDDDPLGTLYVPGIAADASDDEKSTRFQLKLGMLIDPEDDRFPKTRFAIGPGGLQLSAVVDFGDVKLPYLERVRPTEGWLYLDRGAWGLQIGAAFSLPWFSGADGTLTASAGSGPEDLDLSIEAEVVKEVDWGVSYGPVSARAEKVGVSVGWDSDDGWKIDGSLDGAFRLNATRFGKGAGKWLSAVFNSVELAFADVKLSQLASLAQGETPEGEPPEIEVRLLRPIETRLFGVFGFTLERLQLSTDGIEIGGTLMIKAGPAVFTGKLPALSVGFDDGKPTLGIGTGAPGFEFSGSLVVAGGVRGAMSIKYADDDLKGQGALTIPGVASLDVVVVIGRWTDPKGDTHASFGFFGEIGDLKIQLMPGVTLMSFGVGVGVHREMRGTQQLIGMSMDEVSQWLRDNPELPEPKIADNWARGPNQFMLIAAADLMATPSSKSIQPYITRMVVVGNERLELMAFGNAWLLAHPDQYKDLEPTARGVIAFEPRTPSVTGALAVLGGETTLTKDNPLLEMLLAPLFAYDVEAAFSADPDRFRMRIGPSGPPAQDIGGLKVEASVTAAVEVTRSPARAVMGLRATASASFEQSFGFDAGILEARIRFAARGGFDLMALAGLGEVADKPKAGELVIYGQCKLWAAFELSIYLELDLFFFSVSFSLSFSLSADLHFQVGARLEMTATDPPDVEVGFVADGIVTFELMGFEISGEAHLADNWEAVKGLKSGLAGVLEVEA